MGIGPRAQVTFQNPFTCFKANTSGNLEQSAPRGHGRHSHKNLLSKLLSRNSSPRRQSLRRTHGTFSQPVDLLFGIVISSPSELRGQCWHSVIPLESWYFPGSQSTQNPFFEGSLIIPTLQSSQNVAPVLSVVLPGGHTLHIVGSPLSGLEKP